MTRSEITATLILSDYRSAEAPRIASDLRSTRNSVGFGVLAMQGHHREADHRLDELQLLHVLAPVRGEVLVESRVSGW